MRSARDRERAGELARGAAGVLEVDDDLQIASASNGVPMQGRGDR